MHLPLQDTTDPGNVSRFADDADINRQDEIGYGTRVFCLRKFAPRGKFSKSQGTNELRAAISPRHPLDWPNLPARCKCLRTFGDGGANRDR